MEKKFIHINYQPSDSNNKEILKNVLLGLTDYLLRNSQYPFSFKIYSGTGPRNDEGVWLEFEPNKIMILENDLKLEFYEPKNC